MKKCLNEETRKQEESFKYYGHDFPRHGTIPSRQPDPIRVAHRRSTPWLMTLLVTIIAVLLMLISVAIPRRDSRTTADPIRDPNVFKPEELTGREYLQVRSTASIREGPGTEHPIIGGASRNDRLNYLTKVHSDWYKLVPLESQFERYIYSGLVTHMEVLGLWKDNPGPRSSLTIEVMKEGDRYFGRFNEKKLELIEIDQRSGEQRRFENAESGEQYAIDRTGNLGIYDELGLIRIAQWAN